MHSNYFKSRQLEDANFFCIFELDDVVDYLMSFEGMVCRDGIMNVLEM